MQIVVQTKKRSGWQVYRTHAALGVPRSVYYAWKGARASKTVPVSRAGCTKCCLRNARRFVTFLSAIQRSATGS
jgi:hypothetical protein